MSLRILPQPLSGNVTIPPSKSMAHRLMICAGLADGTSRINNIALSEDMKATMRALRAIGRTVDYKGGVCTVSGRITGNMTETIDCHESGSTLRFFIPIVSALGGGKLTGIPRLLERPQTAYEQNFENVGKQLVTDGVITVPAAPFFKGEFTLAGNISSQFISGVLMAAPLLSTDVTVKLTSPLESKGYVDMTMVAMRQFGVNVDVSEDGSAFVVKAGQRYTAKDAVVEGDWSQSGFWFLAGLSSHKGITISGLSLASKQGDTAILRYLEQMGVPVELSEAGMTVRKTALKPAVIDISQTPDLAPVVAGLMALSEKPCTLIGCARLKIKESDRMATVAETLNNLGSKATIVGDTIEIIGKPTGGSIDTHNDHRIAMMAAALSPFCEKDVILNDETVVNKSYPTFWDDFSALGGKHE